MRDETHIKELERWARYVKANPDKWKSKIKLFLDSQILIARRFYKNLEKTKNGRAKITMIRNLSSLGSLRRLAQNP